MQELRTVVTADLSSQECQEYRVLHAAVDQGRCLVKGNTSLLERVECWLSIASPIHTTTTELYVLHRYFQRKHHRHDQSTRRSR